MDFNYSSCSPCRRNFSLAVFWGTEGRSKSARKIVTSQQIILSDEEVVRILREFAQKRTPRFNDVGAAEILLDALTSEDANLKGRVQELIKKFEDLAEKIEDAPDLRSWKIQGTKVCLAESIIFNDLENATQRCGYEPEFSFTAADDILLPTPCTKIGLTR